MSAFHRFDPTVVGDPARAHELAVALDQLDLARRRVGSVRAEVVAAARVLGLVDDIAWSGAAAQAWRTRLAQHRMTAEGAARDLDDLHGGLSRLMDRLAE